MIRYLITGVLAVGLAFGALAQQQQHEEGRVGDVQQVEQFIDELAQRMGEDPDAYMERLSFPLKISVVTDDGEVISGTFDEEQFRVLGYLPTGEIRLHSAQVAMRRQASEMLGQRVAMGQPDEEMEGEEMENDLIVEEELALMPRDQIIEQISIRATDTQVTFLDENVAFVRTTLIVGGEEEPVAAANPNDQEMERLNDEDEPLVEEERALRPGDAHVDLGAIMVRDEGEWRVKHLITGQTEMNQR